MALIPVWSSSGAISHSVGCRSRDHQGSGHTRRTSQCSFSALKRLNRNIPRVGSLSDGYRLLKSRTFIAWSYVEIYGYPRGDRPEFACRLNLNVLPDIPVNMHLRTHRTNNSIFQ